VYNQKLLIHLDKIRLLDYITMNNTKKEVGKMGYLKKFENLVYKGSDPLEFMDRAAKILYEAIYRREINGDVVRIGPWTLYGRIKDFCGVKYVEMTIRYESARTMWMEYDGTEYRARVVEYDEFGDKIMDVVLEGYTPGFQARGMTRNI